MPSPVEVLIKRDIMQGGAPGRSKPIGDRHLAPPKSIEEADARDEAEPVPDPVRPVMGRAPLSPEDIIAGSTFKFLNHDAVEWLDPANGKRYTVTAYYPAAKLIIDYPGTSTFVEAKRRFFASIKQLALIIGPTESLVGDDARKELARQAAAFARPGHKEDKHAGAREEDPAARPAANAQTAQRAKHQDPDVDARAGHKQAKAPARKKGGKPNGRR